MINLLSHLYIHVLAWLEAPYSVTILALSRHHVFVASGLPLLSPGLFLTI